MLVSLLMLFSITVFSQEKKDSVIIKKLETQTALTLSDLQKQGAIFYTKFDSDGDGVFEVYQLLFETLEKNLNWWRTENGNVTREDSVAILHGLAIYQDSTVIENSLIVGESAIEGWGKKVSLPFNISINSGGTQKSFLENGFSIDEDQNNGFALNGWFKPTPTENTANFTISPHVSYTASELDKDTLGKHGSIALLQFRIVGDKWSDDYQNWLGNHRVKNHALFAFFQYFGNTQLTMFDDSVKVHQDFYVTNNSGNVKYLEVNDKAITNNVVSINEAGVTIPVLTASEFNQVKSDLGGSVPKGYTFNLDSNTDGVGDAILHYDGFEFVIITKNSYGGGLVTPN